MGKKIWLPKSVIEALKEKELMQINNKEKEPLKPVKLLIIAQKRPLKPVDFEPKVIDKPALIVSQTPLKPVDSDLLIVEKSIDSDLIIVERELGLVPNEPNLNPTDRRPKCKRCGKPFVRRYGHWQLYCYNPCQPKINNSRSAKIQCFHCGRKLDNGYGLLPVEERLCSFCDKNQRDMAREKREGVTYKTARKCKKCGEYNFLVKSSGLCRTCFERARNPALISMTQIGKGYDEP